jgi:hypothetical protein
MVVVESRHTVTSPSPVLRAVQCIAAQRSAYPASHRSRRPPGSTGWLLALCFPTNLIPIHLQPPSPPRARLAHIIIIIIINQSVSQSVSPSVRQPGRGDATRWHALPYIPLPNPDKTRYCSCLVRRPELIACSNRGPWVVRAEIGRLVPVRCSAMFSAIFEESHPF